jgi:hypothetical protein
MTHTKLNPYGKINIIFALGSLLLRSVAAHLVSLTVHGPNGCDRPVFE